jgi:hypothetical protein
VQVFAAHIAGINAKEGTKARTDAFRLRDKLIKAIGAEQRGWAQSVANAVRRACMGGE